MSEQPPASNKTTASSKMDAMPTMPDRGDAWQIWRNLATENSVAASERDKTRMVDRHKLVVSIIDVNSQQLRCESAIAGLDIERACAIREASSNDDVAKADAAKSEVIALDKRMILLCDESQRLATQREFLNTSLSEFDAVSTDDDKQVVGRA